MQAPCRLRKSTDIEQACRCGRAVKTATVVFQVRDNGSAFPRIAFKLSKRTLKLSVHRNRVKRVHRACLQAKAQALSGKDIVVIARRNCSIAAHTSFQTVEQQWERLVNTLTSPARG